MFLRAEVLADIGRTREVADAIRRLGYTPVEEAKFLQWKRPVAVAGTTQELKIDILVGPIGQYRDRLKVNTPRVRPRGEIEFHAHTVEEAIHIEDSANTNTRGRCRGGAGPRFAAQFMFPRRFPI